MRPGDGSGTGGGRDSACQRTGGGGGAGQGIPAFQGQRAAGCGVPAQGDALRADYFP